MGKDLKLVWEVACRDCGFVYRAREKSKASEKAREHERKKGHYTDVYPMYG